MTTTPRLVALEALVRRVAAHPAAGSFVLRGGMVSRLWVEPLVRPVDDVDLLAEPPLDHDRVRAFLHELPAVDGGDGATVELLGDPVVIWAETEHPGLRASFRVATPDLSEEVRLDVGFGDPLPTPPETITLPTGLPPSPRVRVIPLETGIAWKLHGLFEREEGPWRPKDLHDLDLFTARAFDSERLRAAVPVAFSSRHTPLAATDRLFEGELGRSRKSRAGWEELRAERADLPVSSLEETVERVAGRLRPFVEACLPPIPPREGAFPTIEHLDDVWRVVGGRSRFVAHRRGALTVVNAEANDDWPDPGAATTPRGAHHRAITRECRGLVFGPDGALIARPYHKFFLVGDRAETLPGTLAARVATGRPRVLEKLDGAMVTAGRVDGALRLFTKRGPSPLASAAEAFLSAHPALIRHVEAWIDAGYTPIFEWCARAHRLVVDHPEPRLVLTGLRHRRTGTYVDHDALPATEIDVVPCRGHADDLHALVAAVRAEPEGEGVVLRFDDGHMVKIKTDRYRRLHRAVEAEDPTRAIWEVVVEGETPLLAPLLDPVAAEALAALDQRVTAAIAREIAWITERLASVPSLSALPRGERGAALDTLLAGVTGPRATCLRAAATGQDPAEIVRRITRDMAKGPQARALRSWLS